MPVVRRPAGGMADLGGSAPTSGGMAPALAQVPGSTMPGASLGQALQLPLPENVPIPGAQLFNPLGKATSTVAETNKPIVGPGVGGALLVIPANSIARIDGVVLYVQGLQTTSDLAISLFDGQAPIPGLAPLGIFPGLVALFSLAIECKYITSPGATITATYNNNDGGSYLIGVAVSGWQYTLASAQRWTSQGLR